MVQYVINPKTGRKIMVGGPTYMKLLGQGVKKILKEKRSTSPRLKPKEACSKKTKYVGQGIRDFCGPAGGACPNTYPVNTKGRARAALAYARYAPNPKGIKECVEKVQRRRGWK